MSVENLTNFNLVSVLFYNHATLNTFCGHSMTKIFFYLCFKVQVQRDAVFCNTMNVNMVNMTNNVDLQETGVTVVGDGANVTYHQPPQSFTTTSL